jgi:hypothetical protein
MSVFCRIGLHRWSFRSQLLDEPGHSTHTEVIRARCRRRGCARYGAWRLVHREAHLPGKPADDAPAGVA